MEGLLPLPETFAVLSSLQVLADQEPLTFKALIFLLEAPNPEFHKAFVAACQQAGLNPSFWKPIIDHGMINDIGEHGSISARLLARIECVSVEERVVVLKHVVTMIENLVAFERALLL